MKIGLSNAEILARVREIQPAKNKELRDALGFSSVFAEIFQNVLHFNTTAKQWFFYDGRRWALDECGLIAVECMQRLARALYIYGADADGEFQALTKKIQARNVRDTVLRDAQALIYFGSGDLDADRALLNCQNGVLNVDTLEFKEHDPAFRLSRITSAEYDPDAMDIRWNSFLDQIVEGNKEKLRYLQQLVGYSISGRCSEDTFAIFYGSSARNGKSTLTGAISYALGDYAQSVNADVLAQRQRNGDNANGSLADLRGVLFAVVEEPSKQMILDTSLIKYWTGGSVVNARYVFERGFQFLPRFTLFMNCNSLPQVTDGSLFDADRVRVIPFLRHFSETERDKSLRGTLRLPEVRRAILAWAVAGLRDYLENGLVIPESVRIETNAYKNASDKLGNFLSDACEINPGAVVSVKEAYTAFQRWCEESGYFKDSKKSFMEMLSRHNLFYQTGTINGKTVRNVMRGYKISDYS